MLVSGDAKTGEQNGDTIDLDLGASREGKYLFLFRKIDVNFINLFKIINENLFIFNQDQEQTQKH